MGSQSKKTKLSSTLILVSVTVSLFIGILILYKLSSSEKEISKVKNIKLSSKANKKKRETFIKKESLKKTVKTKTEQKVPLPLKLKKSIPPVVQNMIDVTTDLNIAKLPYKDAISKLEDAGVTLEETKSEYEFGGGILYFKGESASEGVESASMTYDKISDNKIEFVRLEFAVKPELLDIETISKQIAKNLGNDITEVQKHERFYGYETKQGITVWAKEYIESDQNSRGRKDIIYVTMEYIVE